MNTGGYEQVHSSNQMKKERFVLKSITWIETYVPIIEVSARVMLIHLINTLCLQVEEYHSDEVYM
jgi:hypothetical protein